MFGGHGVVPVRSFTDVPAAFVKQNAAPSEEVYLPLVHGAQEEPSPDVPAGQIAQLLSDSVVQVAVVFVPEPHFLHVPQND